MINKFYNVCDALIHASRCVMVLLELCDCKSKERHESLYRIYHFADENKDICKVDRDFYDKVCEFAKGERDLSCWYISEEYIVEVAVNVLLTLLYVIEEVCCDEMFANERKEE